MHNYNHIAAVKEKGGSGSWDNTDESLENRIMAAEDNANVFATLSDSTYLAKSQGNGLYEFVPVKQHRIQSLLVIVIKFVLVTIALFIIYKRVIIGDSTKLNVKVNSNVRKDYEE